MKSSRTVAVVFCRKLSLIDVCRGKTPGRSRRIANMTRLMLVVWSCRRRDAVQAAIELQSRTIVVLQFLTCQSNQTSILATNPIELQSQPIVLVSPL